ncbi:MAG TPA: RNA methyltransferase [Bacilli bacterium]|jgi:TrmH family RNA methyltransferase|nr:RNA methyltransferase [Bacilli bacterium]MDD3388804.1 RNA methyltransferase [Bacilli bacterium]MDD4344594.1 RNA methyltransferase [Bacilli bacterium]MDD4520488.1 RNA methyltransferase [Bacilli bacterium]MDY0399097.1 RNA methyltransferase [Bacilli bacterium]
MIKTISSKKNPYIQSLIALQNTAKSKEAGLFLVDGWHLVDMGRNAGILEALILLTPNENYDEVDQYIVNEEIIDKLKSVATNPGVIGVLKRAPRSLVGGTRLLLLDHIQDPGNLGNLLRSALAFNYDGVLVTPGCADIFHPKVLAATQGAFFFLPVQEITLSGIEDLQREGYQLIVSTLQKATPLANVDIPDLLILVIGNEGHGVDEEIISRADQLVKIPISGLDSLNAASAGAILLYHFRPNNDTQI